MAMATTKKIAGDDGDGDDVTMVVMNIAFFFMATTTLTAMI